MLLALFAALLRSLNNILLFTLHADAVSRQIRGRLVLAQHKPS
jgi:hypothetical protein